MIIRLTNTIGAIGRRLGIVTKNLQMWLGFYKSDVIGKELVVNGDFSDGEADWVFGSNWSVVDKEAVVSGLGNNEEIYQSNNMISGNLYEITLDVSNFSIGTGSCYVTNSNYSDFLTITNNGSYVYRYIATNNTLFIRRKSNATFNIDNISVKEVTQFVKDKSSNSNDAELFTGKALSFNGNDAVSDFGNPNINLKSICFWVNLDTTTEQVFNLTSTHNITASSGVITLGGAWSNSNVYVDGVATTTIGTTPQRVVVTTDTNILVNDLEFARIGSDYGSLDLSDVQIYDAEFTLADALLDYNNPNHLIIDTDSSIALSNLVGYWALSEGSGSIAYDSSGGGNNGTISGATYDDQQPTIPQLGLMDWAKSTIGSDEVTLIQAPNNKGYDILGNSLRLRERGFNLDGSGYAEVADDDSIDMISQFTISLWLKPYVTYDSSMSTYTGVISKASTGDSYAVSFTNSGVINIGTTGGNIQSTKNSWSADTWVNIVATYRAVNGVYSGEMYIDNSLEVLSNDSYDAMIGSVDPLLVGKGGSANFKGIIDEVLLYDRALTSKEVSTNYKTSLNAHKVGSAFSTEFSSEFGF